MIKKWLSDELTPSELEMFKQTEDYAFHKDILKFADHFKAPEVSTTANYENLSKHLEMRNKPSTSLAWLRPALRFAAVFVIGFALYYLFFSDKLVEIQTTTGNKTTIELPDASVVTINALSELSYSRTGWKEQREVRLHGEAFFEVAKGATFDVLTSTGVVSVVGTKFNVKQRDNFFEVSCFEGIVLVSVKDSSHKLYVGDSYRLSNGIPFLSKIADQDPPWTNNRSSFERVALSEVIAELERQYDIKIAVSKINMERLFTGGFVHDDLENALNSVAQPMNLTYTIEASNQVKFFPSEK